jgi:ABC-type glycerol-3-phosphate transport system permease component
VIGSVSLPQEKRRWYAKKVTIGNKLVLDRRNIFLGVCWIGLALVAAACLYPLVFVAFTSLKSQTEFTINPLGIPSHPTLGAFRTVLKEGFLSTDLVNSFMITSISVAVVVVISSFAAFALVFLRFRWRKFVLFGIVGLMIQPIALLMIPEFLIISHAHLLSSYLGIVLVYAALGVPFGTYMMYTYMLSIPRELFDAARVDGAPLAKILYLVILRLLAPAIFALVALDFISFWNEFLFALLILQNNSVKTVMIGLADLQSLQVVNIPVVAAGMAFSIIPPLTVFILLHRRLFSGLTVGAIK